MQVKDRVVFVTGAGSGIGRETALAFARAGARVEATDVDTSGLDSLNSEAAAAGLTIEPARLDVTDRAAYEAMVTSLAARGRLPQIVVNNAGVGYFGSLFDTPPEAWERLLRINIMGVVNGCRLFGPLMVKAGAEGCIVNVASAASATPTPNMSAYAATKFAVEGLSDVLAMELTPTKVRVISVHPGIINTPIVRDPRGFAPSISGAQLDDLQKYYVTNGCHPRVVAEAIVAGVAAGMDKIFVGPAAQTSGWIRRFAPTRLKRRLTLNDARKIGFWRG